MNVLEFNQVWKKFRRGEKFNSLRDTIPNFFRKALRKQIGNGLGKQEFWALRDVSFTVKKGDVLGIIGPNGAGKSTILKLLSRIMIPNKGNMAIKGRLSALIEVAAGFHSELTGRENAYLNGTILGMSRKEIDSKFDEIVEFSGLGEFIDTPVKRYSSGMHSRLGFSVAAHMDQDILLVDEVLAVGDIAFQAKCAQKMREMLKSDTTIVLVSHNLSLIQSLCKRVILINKGEILKEGSTQEVIPYYQNLVFQQSEEEIRKRINPLAYKVRIERQPPVKILAVSLHDGQHQKKTSFREREPISIKVEYEAKEKIDRPVFNLEITRADDVLCCSSNSKDNGLSLESIQGKGAVNIDLGNISLAQGIYVAKVSIWDQDMIHPYAFTRDNILRVEADRLTKDINPVFLPKTEWKLDAQ